VSLALTAPLLPFAAYFWRNAAFAILVVAVAIVLATVFVRVTSRPQ
jgi:hypothetical protein